MGFKTEFFSVLVSIGIMAYGIVPPLPFSGFYCDDESITFKYNGNTISTVMLFVLTLLPPYIVVS